MSSQTLLSISLEIIAADITEDLEADLARVFSHPTDIPKEGPLE